MKWAANAKDVIIIIKLAKRAFELKITSDSIKTEMDIMACHLNGCKLKLEKLLKADDFNFCHDIIGISDNIDRENGKLRNCFSPRFSR